MEKKDFKVGVRFKKPAWRDKSFIDIRFVDEVGLYGVDESGDAYSIDFNRTNLSDYTIITEKKKVWLDEDDLPLAFVVKFASRDIKYLTVSVSKHGFVISEHIGKTFYDFNLARNKLENAVWSPITEINWQNFYKYE